MRRMALLLVLFSVALMLVKADADGKEPRTTYVPLLGREVPTRELRTPVFTADVAFDDFGVPETREMFEVAGRGVKVCVVDTGVDPNHEQIAPRRVRFFDAVNGLTVPYDDHGHGTHVSAIAVGDGKGEQPAAFENRGVAPKARLFVAKVLNAQGAGTFEQVIAGLQWCAERPKVGVINMSLGTKEPSNGTDLLSEVVNTIVRDYGKVVVVAAGNQYEALDSIGSPAAAAEAITVGAAAEWSSRWNTDNYSSGPFLVPFSSRGGTLQKPDVIAPGTTISSAQAGTTGSYVSFSGTSMSAPFVTGVVALMLANDPLLSPADVKAALQYTALDLGRPGWDPDYGYGFVDAMAALGGPAWSFPPHETVTGSVAAGETWTYEFTVTDNEDPVAVTVLVTNGVFLPPDEGWDPAIRARLWYPDGEHVRMNVCPDFWCDRWGRQETMTWDTPGHPPISGVYRIEVEVSNFVNFPTAEFTVDVFGGTG